MSKLRKIPKEIILSYHSMLISISNKKAQTSKKKCRSPDQWIILIY